MDRTSSAQGAALLLDTEELQRDAALRSARDAVQPLALRDPDGNSPPHPGKELSKPPTYKKTTPSIDDVRKVFEELRKLIVDGNFHALHQMLDVKEKPKSIFVKCALGMTDERGDTLLHTAVSRCLKATTRCTLPDCDSTEKHLLLTSIERMLALKAPTGQCNKKKQTPLHYAATTGNMEVCKLLVRHNAPVDQLDHRQKRAEEIALHSKHKELADWLNKRGQQGSSSLVGSRGNSPDRASSAASVLPSTTLPMPEPSMGPHVAFDRTIVKRFQEDDTRRVKEHLSAQFEIDSLKRYVDDIVKSGRELTLQWIATQNELTLAEEFNLHEIEYSTALEEVVGRLTALHKAAESTRTIEQQHLATRLLDASRFNDELLQSCGERQVRIDALTSERDAAWVGRAAAEAMQEELQTRDRERDAAVSSFLAEKLMMEQELERLRAKVNVFDSNLAAVEARAEASEALSLQHANAVASANETIRHLQQTREAQAATIALLSGSIRQGEVSQDENKVLRQQNADIEARNTELLARLSIVEKENERLAIALDESKGQLETNAAQLVDKEADIVALTVELQGVTQGRKELSVQLAALEVKCASMQDEITMLRLPAESPQPHSTDCSPETKDDVAERDPSTRLCPHEHTVMEDKINTLLAERIRLVDQVKELTESLQSAERRAAKAALLTAQGENEIIALRDTAAAASSQSELARREVDTLRQQLLAVSRELEELKRSTPADDTLERFLPMASRPSLSPAVAVLHRTPAEGELVASGREKDLRQRAELLEKQIQFIRQEKDDQIARLKEYSDTYQQREAGLQQVITEQSDHIARLEANLAQQGRDLEGLLRVRQSLEHELAALTAKLELFPSDASIIYEDNAKLKAAVTDLRSQIHILRQEQGHKDNERKMLAELCAGHSSKIERLHQTISELQGSNDTFRLLNEDMERTKSENIRLGAQYKEMERVMKEAVAFADMLELEDKRRGEEMTRLEGVARQNELRSRQSLIAVRLEMTILEEGNWRGVVMVQQRDEMMFMFHIIVSQIAAIAANSLAWSNQQSAKMLSQSIQRRTFDPVSTDHQGTTPPVQVVRAVSALRRQQDPNSSDEPSARQRPKLAPVSALTDEEIELGITQDPDDSISPRPAASSPTPPPTTTATELQQRGDAVTANLRQPCENPQRVPFSRQSIRPMSAYSGPLKARSSMSFDPTDPHSTMLQGARYQQQQTANPYVMEMPTVPPNVSLPFSTVTTREGFVLSDNLSSATVRQFFLQQCAVHQVQRPNKDLVQSLSDAPIASVIGGDGSTPVTKPQSSQHPQQLVLDCKGLKISRGEAKALIDTLRVCSASVVKVDFSLNALSDAVFWYLVLTVQHMLRISPPVVEGEGGVVKTAWDVESAATAEAATAEGARQHARKNFVLREIAVDGTLIASTDALVQLALLLPTLTTVTTSRCTLLSEAKRKLLEGQLQANAASLASPPLPASTTSAGASTKPDSIFEITKRRMMVGGGGPTAPDLHYGRLRRPQSATN